MLASCPVCQLKSGPVCECPLKHQACGNGHHWHADPKTGFTRIDRTAGECVVPKPPPFDSGRFVRAVLRDAAGRAVDAVLADLDARGLLKEAEPGARPLRNELADQVVRVLRGMKPRKRAAAAVPAAAAGEPEGIATDGRTHD